jgi:alcohol dehydrogenase class IV
MALASLFSGLALANAGLGAVHGLAGPLGGRYDAPHGAVVSALLPHVVAANLRALDSRAPDHLARARYDEIGRLLTGRHTADASDAVEWMTAIARDFPVPALSAYGVTAADAPAIATQALQASSMKGNPIALAPDELTAAILAAL